MYVCICYCTKFGIINCIWFVYYALLRAKETDDGVLLSLSFELTGFIGACENGANGVGACAPGNVVSYTLARDGGGGGSGVGGFPLLLSSREHTNIFQSLTTTTTTNCRICSERNKQQNG